MSRLRLAVQILFTFFTNGYLYVFMDGKIYKGSLKYACVPGLNCYSCPGAVASCPIGALQALLNQHKTGIPFGVLGVFFLFGSILGRFVCGWLCPFGMVQDILHKIPLFQKRKRLPFHHILKYGKYARLFYWKFGVLLVILLVSVKIYRPFCQYLCPLGAIYGWFNRFSLVQIHWDKEKCISCGLCEKACPVALKVTEISRSPECIRCGECVASCPEKCLHFKRKNLPDCGKECENSGV